MLTEEGTFEGYSLTYFNKYHSCSLWNLYHSKYVLMAPAQDNRQTTRHRALIVVVCSDNRLELS
jgi:hypothetical protein